MKHYKVDEGPVSVPVGAVVRLSKDQAAARDYALSHIKGSEYEVTQTIHFKTGEAFGIDADMPRAFLERTTAGKADRPKTESSASKANKARKTAAKRAAADKNAGGASGGGSGGGPLRD